MTDQRHPSISGEYLKQWQCSIRTQVSGMLVLKEVQDASKTESNQLSPLQAGNGNSVASNHSISDSLSSCSTPAGIPATDTHMRACTHSPLSYQENISSSQQNLKDQSSPHFPVTVNPPLITLYALLWNCRHKNQTQPSLSVSYKIHHTKHYAFTSYSVHPLSCQSTSTSFVLTHMMKRKF